MCITLVFGNGVHLVPKLNKTTFLSEVLRKLWNPSLYLSLSTSVTSHCVLQVGCVPVLEPGRWRSCILPDKTWCQFLGGPGSGASCTPADLGTGCWLRRPRWGHETPDGHGDNGRTWSLSIGLFLPRPSATAMTWHGLNLAEGARARRRRARKEVSERETRRERGRGGAGEKTDGSNSFCSTCLLSLKFSFPQRAGFSPPLHLWIVQMSPASRPFITSNIDSLQFQEESGAGGFSYCPQIPGKYLNQQ